MKASRISPRRRRVALARAVSRNQDSELEGVSGRFFFTPGSMVRQLDAARACLLSAELPAMGPGLPWSPSRLEAVVNERADLAALLHNQLVSSRAILG